jgi:hypothetical protein
LAPHSCRTFGGPVVAVHVGCQEVAGVSASVAVSPPLTSGPQGGHLDAPGQREMVRAAQAVCSRGGRGRWNRKRRWRCLGPLGSGLCDLIPPLAPRPWVPSGLWDGTGQAAGTPSCPESPEATSSQPAALAGQLHPQTQVFPDCAVMREAMDGSLLFMTSVRAGSGRCCAGTHLSFL